MGIIRKRSKRVFIECVECGCKSPYVDVNVCDEDGVPYWEFIKCPEGWFVEAGEAISENCSVFGYCPEHHQKVCQMNPERRFKSFVFKGQSPLNFLKV